MDRERSSPAGGSFADTLSQLEQAREELKHMFEPAPGWEWHSPPGKAMFDGVSAGQGVVTQGFMVAGDRSPGGGRGEPHVGVSISHVRDEDDEEREYRPVAYDRDGERYVFAGKHAGSTSASQGTRLSVALFRLAARDLPAADVAFVGVETRERPADE